MFFSAFTTLFRREQSPPAAPGDILTDLGRVETFPTLSDTATRTLAVTNDPDATLADLAELIRRDGFLAAAVLKLANSAAYRGRYPTETLSQATNRLGMTGCQRVIAAVGVRGMFKAPTPLVAAACDVLLRHALFTAAVAARLNAAGRLGFRGEEFTAGLLHDIGRVILCARAPDAFWRIDPMTFREGLDTLADERDGIGIDHCEVGLLFARANALPQPIAAAIRHHHTPEVESDHGTLVALTATADALTNHVQRERKLSDFRPETCFGYARLAALIGAYAIRDVRKAISAAVVDALRETRAMLRITAH
jgi:putative nucleotidyltransferase with HDIG domain